MPTNGEPIDQLKDGLDLIFGGREHWESIYRPSLQPDLWGEQQQERPTGSEGIADLYRKRFESAFVKVAPTQRILRNSKNSPLFELFFAASNPNGAAIAIPIANHILKNW